MADEEVITNEAEPLDAEGRTEAALAALNEPETEAGTEQPAVEVAAEGEGQGEAEQPATEGQLTDEQRNADPVFKELTDFRTATSEVFDKYGISAAAEASGRTPQQEVDLQLGDSNVLYGIMRGDHSPSELLDAMAANSGWSKEQVKVVANNLMEWCAKQGFAKDGAAPAAAAKGAPAFNDPLAERLARLESANEQAARAAQERVQQVERDRVGKVFTDQIEKLATTAGIAKDDIPFYATQVGALVGGNKAVIDRVAKGNFVDIKRFFDTVHNNQLAFVKRYNTNQLAAQAQKARNPKTPAGGGPAAPVGQAKRSAALTRDERIAAASEYLQGN